MDKQLWLHALVTSELKRCEKLYNELSQLFPNLLKGSLLNRNGHIYHAYRENGKQWHKPLNNEKLIQEVRLYQFIKKGLPSLKSRIDACKLFLQNEKFYDPLQIIDNMKDIYSDIDGSHLFLDEDIDPYKWQTENYERNPAEFKERHYTDNGLLVRSKSEAMIGTQLEYRKHIFRCEPLIKVGNKVKAPDFAIFLPNRRRVVFLEHFGKMGEAKYLKDTMDKLALYRQHGLYLGINFFFTWESREAPLTLFQINSVLNDIEALDKCA